MLLKILYTNPQIYVQGATQDRLSTVRYGELQYSGGKIYTKETFFMSRFENALQCGQLEREYEVFLHNRVTEGC
jgi:hypothetical protein